MLSKIQKYDTLPFINLREYLLVTQWPTITGKHCKLEKKGPLQPVYVLYLLRPTTRRASEDNACVCRGRQGRPALQVQELPAFLFQRPVAAAFRLERLAAARGARPPGGP